MRVGMSSMALTLKKWGPTDGKTTTSASTAREPLTAMSHLANAGVAADIGPEARSGWNRDRIVWTTRVYGAGDDKHHVSPRAYRNGVTAGAIGVR